MKEGTMMRRVGIGRLENGRNLLFRKQAFVRGGVIATNLVVQQVCNVQLHTKVDRVSEMPGLI